MFIRIVLYTLIAILVLTAIRMFAGVLSKGLGSLLDDSDPVAGKAPGRPSTPVGGALKRDPVCGTFVSADTSIRKQSGNEFVYFCSAACRDKYSG